MSAPVSGPEDAPRGGGTPVRFGGRAAVRYTVRRRVAYTGDAALDAALGTFSVLVLVPEGRPLARVPVVTLLHGITAPVSRSAGLVGPLVDAGFAAVLFDMPLAGERRLSRGPGRNPSRDLAALAPLDLTPAFARSLFGGVAGDLKAALDLVAMRHGLAETRRGRTALFGVSFGGLLSAHAFVFRDVGARLLIASGHADLPRMARGLAESVAGGVGVPLGVLETLPNAALEGLARQFGGAAGLGALKLARLLVALGEGGPAAQGLDPLERAASVTRPVRFMTGALDRVATPEAARAAAARFPDGAARVVPGLGHGWVPAGAQGGPPSFPHAVTDFVLDALADWREPPAGP